MPKVSTQKIRGFQEGLIQATDPSITPPSAYLSSNFLYHKILGRAVMRKGITMLGSQIVNNKSCLGLYQHITAAGVKMPLCVMNDVADANSDIFKYVSSWVAATGGTNLTKNIKCHFETFLDTTIIVNGTDGARTTIDGTTWIATGGNLDAANVPAGKYVKEFKDKLYVAGVSGNLDRLYYSSTSTAGAISWTSGHGHIDIEREEGAGAITGLAKVPAYLLIFKERSMKRWDLSSTHPESLISIGAPSQEAIVETKQSVYYFNERGIYATNGGYPIKISTKIQDIIDAIPSSYLTSVSGWGDGENVYFSIGDIEIDGYTFNNAVIQFNINSQIWALLSFPFEFKMWNKYVGTNGQEEILAGDDDGQVWRVFQGTTDNGVSIKYLFQTQSQEFGSRGRIDNVNKLVVYSKNMRSDNLLVRINEKNDFKPKGIIKNDVQELSVSLSGRIMEFRIIGKGRDDIQFIGIDFPELFVNLNYNV